MALLFFQVVRFRVRELWRWRPQWTCSPDRRTGGGQKWGETVFDVLKNQPLEALHNYWREGIGAVII